MVVVNIARFPRGRPFSPIAALVDIFRDWIERFVAVQGVDRSMAIAAQAYSAFLPLMIVYASLLPRTENESFAEVLCKELRAHRRDGGQRAPGVRARGRRAVERHGAGHPAAADLDVVVHARPAAALRGCVRARGARDAQHAARPGRGSPFVGVEVAVRPVATRPFDGWMEVAITIAMAVGTLARDAVPAARPPRALAAPAAERCADRLRHGLRRHLVGDLDAAHDRELRRRSSA